MRLPYIQIAMEVIEQAAPDVAVELEADEAAIGWGLVKVIRWALGRCPDYVPPSASATIVGPHAAKQIARAAGWAGDPDAFVDAVARVQPAPLFERAEGSIRIRGLDRYDAAWGKSHPEEWKAWKESHPEKVRGDSAPKPGRNRSETGPEPERVGVGLVPVSGLQTQTQTQSLKTVVAREVGGLRDGLDAIFLKAKGAAFNWTPRDEEAIRPLLAHPEAEVLRRWEIGLGTRYPACNSVRDLVANWNAYAAAPPAAGAGPPRNTLRRGVARAEDADHSKNRVVDEHGTIEL